MEATDHEGMKTWVARILLRDKNGFRESLARIKLGQGRRYLLEPNCIYHGTETCLQHRIKYTIRELN